MAQNQSSRREPLLSPSVLVYLYGTSALAAAALLWATTWPSAAIPPVAVALVVLLAITRNMRVDGWPGHKFDCAPMASFALVVLLPPREAVTMVACGEVIGRAIQLARREQTVRSALFNMSESILTTALVESIWPDTTVLWKAAEGAVLYLWHTASVAVIVSLQRGVSLWQAWWGNGQRLRVLLIDAYLMVLGLVSGVTAELHAWVPFAVAPLPFALKQWGRQRAVAEAEIRLRDDFIRQAGHELRTPMTTLYGYVQLLRRRWPVGTAGAPDRVLRVVEEQSRQLTRLVNRMLDVSLLQGGQLVLEEEPVALLAFADALVERLQVLAPETALRATGKELVVTVDPVRLDQVVTNLVLNAVRHAETRLIEVEVGQDASGCPTLAVRDHGRGVPEAERERIFDRYWRGGGANQESGGLGLGLYISQQCIAAHGGTLTLETPPDGGARFVATLPRHRLHAAPAAVARPVATSPAT